jgi:hypothetical protein
MSYQLNKSDGGTFLVLADGTVEYRGNMGFMGRNLSNYGQILNENTVRITENFANSVPPTVPLIGQIWFDTSVSQLKVYTPTGWQPLLNSGSVVGTAGQVIATVSGQNQVVLSLPQSVATTATPEFASVTLTQPTGTAPLTVSSTTLVSNLNAEFLNGQPASFYTNYNNLSNSPAIPVDVSDLTDTQNLLPGTMVRPTRQIRTVDTGLIPDQTTVNFDVLAYKTYVLYKITTSEAAWIKVYSTAAARAADSTRDIGDPVPVNAGVVAQAITAGAETVTFVPALVGFNDESTVTSTMPIAVTNLAGTDANITVTLTVLDLED